MPQREFVFAGFRLTPHQRELLRDGRPVRVEKIPFDLLVLLLERAGDLVTREEITARLWGPGVFQDLDASLNTAVRKLRAALRDQPDHPRFVQTVVGQGYRFLERVEIRDLGANASSAVVERTPSEAAPPVVKLPHRRPWLAVALCAILAPSIWFGGRAWLDRTPDVAMVAVLPFEDFDEDPSHRYFSQGLTEEIITQLGRASASGVGIIAGPSVRRYAGKNPPARQIADELGAGYVLTGTARREGSTMRITARLVRTRGEIQIWAQAFDGQAGDMLAIQQEVALSVERAIADRLRRGPSATVHRAGRIGAEAYDLYLRGRYYWNQRSESSLKLAIDYFRETLAREPDYAPAHAALADCYALLVYGCYLAPTEGFSQARAELERARSLDPSSPELLASEGYLSMYFDWDLDTAERKFDEAIAANPNYASAYDWKGVLLTAKEKTGWARGALERAIRLDPGSLPIATDLGFHLHYSGRNKQAEAALQAVLFRDPNFGLAHFWMGRVLSAEGDCKGALSELAQAPVHLQNWQPLVAARGYVSGVCGDSKRAQSDLRWFQEMGKTKFATSYGIALIEAGLGDREAALMWLRKAVEERSHWMVWIRLDPRFKTIRSDPRFQQLVGKVFPKN